MPPTDPRDATPEDSHERAFPFVLGAWAVDLNDEVSFYRQNPQAQWQYSAEQYSRKLWMHEWHDLDVPPHWNSLFKLSYNTDQLLDRWKEGRGNEARPSARQGQLWGRIEENISSKMPREVWQAREYARSQLSPEESDRVSNRSPQQRNADYRQSIEAMAARQAVIKSPVLREQIAAQTGLLNHMEGSGIGGAPPADRGTANAPSASGIITAGEPAPSQRNDSTTGTAAALPGLRGRLTARDRRTRPESVQGASASEQARPESRTGSAPSQRNDPTTGTAAALPGLRGRLTARDRRTPPESAQGASVAQPESSTQPLSLEERRTQKREERASSRERDQERSKSRERDQGGNGLG
jgi:hypothetical protein